MERGERKKGENMKEQERKRKAQGKVEAKWIK
jgi:hypothetical protein